MKLGAGSKMGVECNVSVSVYSAAGWQLEYQLLTSTHS